MKFNRTGRFQKEKVFIGSTDIQNVTASGWSPVKVENDSGFYVPNQSISVVSSNASEMSPTHLRVIKVRDNGEQDQRG